MKIKLTILVALFTVQATYAQIGAGNLFAGGTMEIVNNTNTNSFTFSPTAYYFISDQLAIGGSVGFQTWRNNPGEDDYTRTNFLHITPAVRYFWTLTDQAYIYGQGSLGLSFGGAKNYVGNTSTDAYDDTNLRLGVGTGVMYLLSPSIGVDLGLNLFSFNRNSRTTPQIGGGEQTTTDNSFRLGINTLSPSFGLYYFF
ncbi:outer membrane beta-barrel protein [Marivirga sp. S37H4]|uniref:Outer membrane beta-barrel protein n=1 Tax=Marivirga aurantiaca TaxID=2802615 RepID=A0A934WWU0_9BACT|nr:outer membrane beta-barrel protein [Marivirga aurantiaca]MBK6264558.1 outer membrane beta-barrel protein [Marivirga aurantiaca]